jgi:hypothetical protein
LHAKVLFTQSNLEVVLKNLVLVVGDLVDERPVDSLVHLFLLLEAVGDFLGKVEAQVANGLTLQHLLWLVELFSHKSIEVIVQDEVFELGKLLR